MVRISQEKLDMAEFGKDFLRKTRHLVKNNNKTDITIERLQCSNIKTELTTVVLSFSAIILALKTVFYDLLLVDVEFFCDVKPIFTPKLI